MKRKGLRHVEHFTDRHGKPRFYFRRGKGARIALPGKFGSDEFNAAYAAALQGDAQTSRPTIVQHARGTLAALIASYYQSSAYRDLRATSKVGYRSRIETIRVEHGHRTVAGMTRDHLEKLLQAYDNRPGAKLDTLKKFRILIQHAIRIGWLKADPSIGIKRAKGNEIRSWTESDIAQFTARWPIGTRQRTAFELMLHTGQRRSDVHRMTWADIDGGSSIRIVQQKTRAKLSIPLHEELRAALVKADRSHMTIINTEHGRPFTVDGFSQWMRDAIRAAGLPLDCQPHGLRKAAGRRMAEAGCTSREIMAVLGHRTLAEAERYTRDADQVRLASTAMLRLEGRSVNTVSPTRISKFGKNPKKNGDTTR